MALSLRPMVIFVQSLNRTPIGILDSHRILI